MTAPLVENLSKEAARHELSELKNSIESTFGDSIEGFEERAHNYNLTPREFAVWERVSELRWLLGDE
ncbi:hypothetical protein [Corynebacterium sp. NML130628]|uniref:hypothetical protein n=1 Tax=Corynebacterium sp. NML130628 TaxID=1906333 RepID=UPI0008FB9F20|nr:hypothetical protein [Corynebacterium sp. NML130628]OIR46174.1 hypothetical protein BJP07_01775 [Corynebacterium sp. NML130628]